MGWSKNKDWSVLCAQIVCLGVGHWLDGCCFYQSGVALNGLMGMSI